MANTKSSYFDKLRAKRESQATKELPVSSELPQEALPVKEEPLFVEDSEDEFEDAISVQRSEDFTKFKDALTNVLGPLGDHIIEPLYQKFSGYDDKVLLAIDYHLRGDVKMKVPKSIPPITLSMDVKRKRTRGIQMPLTYNKRASPARPTESESKPTVTEWKRFLGTLFADAYATRPYLKSLSYLQKMSIRSLKPRVLTGKQKKRTSDTAVIRLYTSTPGDVSDGREIGRLKEDLTRILAPLLDLCIFEFEVTVALETTKRLMIGDEFYVKIDCFLTSGAFEKTKSPINELDTMKETRTNITNETEEESNLRLRKFAVAALFSRLQIRPVKAKDSLGATQVNSSDENPHQIIDLDSDEDDLENNELSLDELQTFYSENQQSEMLKALPNTTTPPAENFSLQLREYQKLGLSWMLAREKELDVLKSLNSSGSDLEESFTSQSIDELQLMEDGVMNPLWKTFRWPKLESKDVHSDVFYGNMYSGELSLQKPLIKSSLRGGILADEMGLGKTISTLALINSVPYDTRSSFHGDQYASQTTLIIVPMSLLAQWENEFDKANNNLNHKCIVYYGSSTPNLQSVLLNKTKHIPIVVITTYGTVASEFARLQNRGDLFDFPGMGLYSVKFFRIILDEGHQIRNRTNESSKAIFQLQSSRKWILTGTPIINGLDDLYSLAKFLELEPWSNLSYWKMFVSLPFKQKQAKQTLDVIKTILEPIFLRRTKSMKGDDGNPLVDLPPKEVVIEEVEFNNDENQVYSWFKDLAYKQFRDKLNSGESLRKHLWTHILRLRQICCHQDLIKSLITDMKEQNLLPEDTVEHDIFKDHTEMMEAKYKLYDKIDINNSECSICTKTPIDMSEISITTCGHTFCLNCVIEHLEFQKKKNQNRSCPNCRGPISTYKIFKVRDKKDFDFDIYLYDPSKVSSKVQALINHIVTLKDQNLTEPVIVISQFSSYLEIIETELLLRVGEKNIRCLKFVGSLSKIQRQEILEQFNNSAHYGNQITVLLLSLKAGGVGLNLTNASRAFMMDPWWSPSIEEQAIDRLHRIGQQKTVKVIRFIMKNSIELKILKIQQRKKQLGEVVAADEDEQRRVSDEEIRMLFEE
ncbi:hypothetical protein CANTEDRAFT_119056 [Yamadazyma tenuis ATCC 10573]|uniref:DNA repair protein RAD5 n=1 Tax=Candida tenuis (strain ATCC 10573 / BCRC 21748 / CBS 615 / JCM 9827 / NBRC 10315 / NRRL Y-1498 / VKM Y-70) TaxID=590646 RepID=G3AZ48_CANTC|nr:uncharacterized protein CANTEDRAFT_119056 [Yamadazyma tenuis ATCC 10573]EGV66007.1 hypothetical protein CANTEDRAFT_119056 [Yamadazyma tenuis ATCC 10573]